MLDSSYLFNTARWLMDEYGDNSATQLLALANSLLKDAEAAGNADERLENAAQAWVAAVYAQTRARGDETLQKKIEATLANIARILDITPNDPAYLDTTLDYLKGKYPDNCGVIKGTRLIANDIKEIIIDDGIGGKNIYYFVSKNAEENTCFSRLNATICFEILKKIPVTPALRDKGVTGENMTFIHKCVRPD